MNTTRTTVLGRSVEITRRQSGDNMIYDYKIFNQGGVEVASVTDCPDYDSAIDDAADRITAAIKPHNHQ